MANHDYDVLVIGTGPGGEGAAMQATKGGLKVGVCERYAQIGGGCTHWGTIPSKAIRYGIHQLTEAKQQLRGQMQVDSSFPDMREHAERVIGKQVDMRRGFYERNDVDVIKGNASFTDAHTLQVDGKASYTADTFVIATGSRPYQPDGVDFNHPRIFDSDTVLNLAFTPHSVTIYGAGVIGCEYASMFRNLGIKVNLINTRDKLLSFLDDEIIDALSYHLRDQGGTDSPQRRI